MSVCCHLIGDISNRFNYDDFSDRCQDGAAEHIDFESDVRGIIVWPSKEFYQV